MSTIKWEPSCSVGVRELDDQHRELFQLIEALEKLRGHADAHLLTRVLNTLVEYTKRHFFEEERMLAAIKYPKLAEHQGQHRAFTAKIEEFRRAYENGERQLEKQVLEYVAMWIKSHILIHDHAYATYRAQHGITV